MASELIAIKTYIKNVLISSDMCFLTDPHRRNAKCNDKNVFCLSVQEEIISKLGIKFHWIITA